MSSILQVPISSVPGPGGVTVCNGIALTHPVLQVLISIQALILVPQPYYNEPGFEASMGTPAGDAETLKYNCIIREATLKYAMVEQLRNLPVGFEQPTQLHFRHRKAPPLPRASTAFVANAPPLPCASTAFVAKTSAFALWFHCLRG